jgi:alkanesulfonate monooxygenase SsuD/methylene tetrahydromethanopterin reductase-like flavin-dependent oxidoreductase (luciferase family)
MNEAWREGRRREATELIPDEEVQNLVLYGDVDETRAGLDRYREAGVDTTILMLMPTASDAEGRARQSLQAMRDLAP